MAKTKEQKKLDALDARVRALEAHNGWTPGEAHDDDTDDTDAERANDATDAPRGNGGDDRS